MVGLTVALVLALAHSNVGEILTLTNKQDAKLTTPQIIRRHGYAVETHTVLTDDGYLLGVHRIPVRETPSTESNLPPPRKSPVLLQHGLMASSADWVLAGPNHAFAYKLAEQGYDVWMGNARGNKYSRAHIQFSPDEQSFWDFSWDQMAQYDLPAVVDHILEVTDSKSLYYVGHSMGTTIFFAMMAENPHYQNKVKLMVALAPVASVRHIPKPLKVLSYVDKMLVKVGQLTGNGELIQGADFVKEWKESLCKGSGILAKIKSFAVWISRTKIDCSEQLFSWAGYELENYKKQVQSGRFSKYDFGDSNQLRYNTPEPPEYNLTKIKLPVLVFQGGNDNIVASEDVACLINKLPNLVEKITTHNFNHIDYLYHVNASHLVYAPIISAFDKF